MGRVISIVVLVALVSVFGFLFFQVMAGFLLPVFLAVLLAVIFRPLHRRLTAQCRGYVRVAAGVTTLAILLIVLVPLLLVILRASTEAIQMYRDPDQLHLDQQALTNLIEKANERLGLTLDPTEVHATIVERIQAWLGPLAARTPAFLGRFLIGFAVMTISLYYFLADGEEMIISVGKLLPLDLGYQRQLLDQFADVSRAVTSATLLSALAQGILSGIAYYFAGLSSVFLLTMITMLAAMIPFVGAAVVWIPGALWLYFFADSPTAGILLAIWGGGVVSMVDNLIKPLVLHGQSKLHPLLALLSVLGGAEALGPIGIFVGPMAVAFLQAGLTMLNVELSAMQTPHDFQHHRVVGDNQVPIRPA